MLQFSFQHLNAASPNFDLPNFAPDAVGGEPTASLLAKGGPAVEAVPVVRVDRTGADLRAEQGFQNIPKKLEAVT